MLYEYKTLNEALEDGSFTFKEYTENPGDFMTLASFSGLTKIEQQLVKDWFGDRLLCDDNVKKFTKFFNRQWELYCWDFRNRLASWLGSDAQNPGILNIRYRVLSGFTSNNWVWNTKFLVNLETTLSGSETSETTGTGTNSNTTKNTGTITNEGSGTSKNSKTGKDITSTENSGSDTNSGGTTSNTTTDTNTSGSSNDETDTTNISSTTTATKHIEKANPMSISNAGATAGQIPALDWSYGSGASQDEQTVKPDGKTDKVLTKGTSSSGTTTTNGNTTKDTRKTDRVDSGTSTITYGGVDTGETSNTNTTTNDTQTKSDGTNSNTQNTTNSNNSKNTGRTQTLAELYGEFLSLLDASQPWEWMREKLEPCFLAVYDI